MRKFIKRGAFTLIELIFVIVVLGIVASIGSQIIAKIYESYLYSNSSDNIKIKTELALNKIAKLLSSRIKGSIIARMPSVSGAESSQIAALGDANDSYKVLEWIDANSESRKGEWNSTDNVPGWSGFIDLESNETNQTQVKTPGSHLSFAEDIIYALSHGDVNISENSGKAVLIFDGLPNDFNVTKYGWNDWTGSAHHEYTFRCKRSGEDVIKFTEASANTVYEHYKLAWSAYAIAAVGDNDKNLTLFYNYRPWMGEKYIDSNNSVLIEHVSVFKFLQKGTVLRIKLCAYDPIMADMNVSFCKEKVVF